MFDKKNKGTSDSGPPVGRGMRDRSPIRRTIANNSSNSGPEPFISGFHPQQNHFTSPAVMNTQAGIPMTGVPGPGLPFHRDSMNSNAGSYVPHHHPAAHLSIPTMAGSSAPVPPAVVNAVGQPPPVEQVNEIEIIVISKDQWQYAEMIEQRIRREIGIRAIDILFLHAPQHISMTLNDLFERCVTSPDPLFCCSTSMLLHKFLRDAFKSPPNTYSLILSILNPMCPDLYLRSRGSRVVGTIFQISWLPKSFRTKNLLSSTDLFYFKFISPSLQM